MFDFSKGTIRYREYLSADMWSENLFKKLYFGGVGGNMSAKSLISWLKFETRYMIYRAGLRAPGGGRAWLAQESTQLPLISIQMNCTFYQSNCNLRQNIPSLWIKSSPPPPPPVLHFWKFQGKFQKTQSLPFSIRKFMLIWKNRKFLFLGF